MRRYTVILIRKVSLTILNAVCRLKKRFNYHTRKYPHAHKHKFNIDQPFCPVEFSTGDCQFDKKKGEKKKFREDVNYKIRRRNITKITNRIIRGCVVLFADSRGDPSSGYQGNYFK